MAYKDKNKAIEYNNAYNARTYDRVSLMLPKGTKSIVQAAADAAGETLNGYITKAIYERMEKEKE